MCKVAVSHCLLACALMVYGCAENQTRPPASPSNDTYKTRPTSPQEDEAVANAQQEVGPTGVSISDEILRLCPGVKPPYFDFDSSNVRGQFRATLVGIADCMKDGGLKDRDVLLVGHADPRGEEDYNLSLGGRRAQAVRSALHALGAPADKLDISSRGELEAQGVDEATWAKDRRVDIRLAE